MPIAPYIVTISGVKLAFSLLKFDYYRDVSSLAHSFTTKHCLRDLDWYHEALESNTLKCFQTRDPDASCTYI